MGFFDNVSNIPNAAVNAISEPDATIPDYMIAADAHNIGNGNESFIERAGSFIYRTPEFLGVSVVSGLNSIWNTGISVGNWAGGDFEHTSTSNILQNIDSDVADFYNQHQQGADAVGFLLTSILPGVGGIKILNAGQRVIRAAIEDGAVGTNVGRALGLLAPDREGLLKIAKAALTDSSSIYSSINAASIRAIGAGVGQSFLEGAAFQTAVAATMQQSPLMNDKDIKDIGENILEAGLLNGVIGGAFETAKVFNSLSKARNISDEFFKPVESITGTTEAMPPANRIIQHMSDLENLPTELPSNVPAGLTGDLSIRFNKSREATVTKLQNLIGSATQELSNGDVTIGAQFNSALRQLDGVTTGEKLNYLTSIGKLGQRLKAETQLAKLTKDITSGMISLDPTPAELEKLQVAMDSVANTNVAYLKVHGEGAGVITDTAPAARNIADTLKAGQDVVFKDNAVRVVDSVTNSNLSTVATWNPDKTIPIVAKNLDSTTALKEVEARYIAALESPPLKEGATVHIDDIPKLEKAYREGTAGLNLIDTGAKKGLTVPIDTPINSQEFLKLIQQSKDDLANELTARGKLSPDQIAKIVNVRGSYLGGENSANKADDLFAMQKASQDYTKQQIELGAWSAAKGDIKTYLQPSIVKMGYSKHVVTDIDNNVLMGIAAVKEEFRVTQMAVNNATNGVFGGFAPQAIEIPAKTLLTANRGGAGSGLLKLADGVYGTIASAMEQLGSFVSRVTESKVSAVNEALNPLVTKLANNPKAALEWSILNNRLRQIPDAYVPNSTGDGLILRTIKRSQDDAAAGIKSSEAPKLIDPSSPHEIPFSSDIADLVLSHIELNGRRVSNLQNIRGAQGLSETKDPNIFYPIPVDTKAYPFFRTVIDPSITGTGHSRRLYGTTEEEVAKMADKVKASNPEFRVLSKQDSEDYYKATGQFEFGNTLHDNYIDSALARSGVSASYYVPTDPVKIAKDLLAWHVKEEAYVVRSAVNSRYEAEFDHLRKLGDNFTNSATSKIGNTRREFEESSIENPYTDYIKVGLNVSKQGEYPIWGAINNVAEKAVGKVWQLAQDTLGAATKPSDLDAINAQLQEAGIKSAYYDAATNAFANANPAPRVLSNFISKANSIMSSLTLGLDPINGINNFLGSHVLTGTEFASVIRSIKEGDASGVGALSAITNLRVVGTNTDISTAKRLIANSYSRFFKDDGTLMQFYKDNGFITDLNSQVKSVLDMLTITGKESEVELNSRLQNAIDTINAKASSINKTGYKITGNKFFEELNRFVAADSMKQLTDIAVAGGNMTEREALGYINTAVNRTQGNFLASQRPMVFQGPIGQAIGLFQTYQFNLIQQLLRHVGEGSAKDAATLLGLQSTIYGMNGLPAFNAINQHIVGTMSGNTKHTDLYSSTYGAVGKEAGDWLLYGLSSNMLLDPSLKTNLYTRGDVNPRQITILPNNPSEVPIVGAFTKFFAAMSKTVSNIDNGGAVWSSLMQGVEHGSISRPLSGLAQVLESLGNPNLQSFSTTNKGNIVASNDLFSLANMARIAGAKPLDEAIAIDLGFRTTAYGLADSKSRQELGAAIKTKVIGGSLPTTDDLNGFATEYAARGGQQTEFNKWFMGLYKTANSSQINAMAASLRNPVSQNMQKVMGGYAMKDFTNNGLGQNQNKTLDSGQ